MLSQGHGSVSPVKGLFTPRWAPKRINYTINWPLSYCSIDSHINPVRVSRACPDKGSGRTGYSQDQVQTQGPGTCVVTSICQSGKSLPRGIWKDSATNYEGWRTVFGGSVLSRVLCWSCQDFIQGMTLFYTEWSLGRVDSCDPGSGPGTLARGVLSSQKLSLGPTEWQFMTRIERNCQLQIVVSKIGC